MTLKIDGERLIGDLRKLAEFGKLGTGVARIAYSDVDMEARAWFQDRLNDAGLDARLDRVGNVIGTTPGADHAVLIGSHTDTVPAGGWLDGAMGAVYGLEIARAAIEQGMADSHAVDVVAFQDEEGTYLPCIGSMAICGEANETDIAAAESPAGEKLTDALSRCGLQSQQDWRIDPDRHVAFLEAHIEQGPRLEADGKRLGLVTGIVGIRRFALRFDGQADHAGTTPMALRKDAGRAAFQLGMMAHAAFQADGGEETVWNIGKADLIPGAANVVPSAAEMIVEFRDLSEQTLDKLEARLGHLVDKCAAATNTTASLTRTAVLPPSPMTPAMTAHLAAAADAAGEASMTMPSGAGHDAMILARHLPTAMLFVPSIGGRSHDIVEDTAEEDIILGCQVMANAVGRILA